MLKIINITNTKLQYLTNTIQQFRYYKKNTANKKQYKKKQLLSTDFINGFLHQYYSRWNEKICVHILYHQYQYQENNRINTQFATEF